MVCAPVATGNDEWPESLRSLPGHTVVLHVSIRSLGSQTPVVPPWPHQEGNEGRMLGFASQPGFGKALGGMFPSPRPGASGHLDGRLEPVLSRAGGPAPVFSLWCLTASPAPVGAGCLHSGQSWHSVIQNLCPASLREEVGCG